MEDASLTHLEWFNANEVEAEEKKANAFLKRLCRMKHRRVSNDNFATSKLARTTEANHGALQTDSNQVVSTIKLHYICIVCLTK